MFETMVARARAVLVALLAAAGAAQASTSGVVISQV